MKQPNFSMMKLMSGASVDFHVNKELNFLVKRSTLKISMNFCESHTILHVLLSYFHEKKKILRIIFQEVRMNFCSKKITITQSFNMFQNLLPEQNFHINANNVQKFDPVNYVMEIVMTDFDTGLDVLEFLQLSFHMTRKINFYEIQITSLQVKRNISHHNHDVPWSTNVSMLLLWKVQKNL